MDLDVSQRLSLVERNMEAAQVNMDSARELVRVLIEQWNSVPMPTQDTEPRPKPEKQSKRIISSKDAGPKATIINVIREFVAHQKTGTFSAEDVRKWATAAGYRFSRKQYASNVGVGINQKRLAGVSNTDYQGVYKITPDNGRNPCR